MSYEIETDVPIPTHKYGWADMKVGHSFLVSVGPDEEAKIVADRLHRNANYHGYSVKTRREKGGVRVWMLGPKSGPPPPS